MMLLRSAVPFLALLALAPAQDPAFRFVPKDAALVVRMGAPARWKKDFADTAMAKLMAAPALQPMMQQAGQMMDMMMAEARDSGFDADLVERMLATYEGDFVFSVSVDWKKADLVSVGDEEPSMPVFMTIAATPHASYDLAALAKAIDGAAAKAMEEPDAPKSKELAVGDHRLRAVEDGDGMWGTMPALVDGHLVMFFGADLDAGVAKAIEGADRFEAADAAGKPMFLHADVAGFVGALEQSMVELEEMGAAPFDMGEMLDAIGLRALGNLRMTVGADGKHLVSDVHMGMSGDKRGLFAMLPQTSAQPKLLRTLPASASNWTVTPIDLGALYAGAEKFVTLLETEMPMSWADMMTAMAEELKVRLKEDLIDHLGGEMMLLSDAGDLGDDEDDSPMAAVGDMCMAFSLRDGAAFGKSLETMLRARGLHAARKTEEYQGAKIHRMTLAAVLPLEYAVTDDMLLLALGDGEGVRASLRGVLDAKAAGGAELPAALKAHVESVPAGWCGVGLTRPADTMLALAKTMESITAEAPADDPEVAQIGMITGVLSALGAEMKRLGVETSVAFVYSGPAGVTYRLRW
jgi:hypothetical protein